MPLSLTACAVGSVTIIRCSGRIVTGAEADGLRRHVSTLLPDCRDIVLHLGSVAFIDSTGMGTLARLLIGRRLLRLLPGGWLTLLLAPRVAALVRVFWRRRQARRDVLAAR